ncbi:uncharacterized protein LOC144007908 isoform X2 [Festucalex cinctus]
MCKVRLLRALVTERLNAAVEEIFGLFENTIAEYEEELCRSKDEIERQRQLLMDARREPQGGFQATDVRPSGVDDDDDEGPPDCPEEEAELSHVKEEDESEDQPESPHLNEHAGEPLLHETGITKFHVKSEDEEEDDEARWSELRKTGRKYRRKTKKGLTPADVMMRAVREVKLNNQSIRSTAKNLHINYRTLARYCSKITQREVAGDAPRPSLPVGYVKSRLVFSPEQERQLADYVTAAADIYFGVSPAQVRKLAYGFALRNDVALRQNWADNRMAGADWLSGFVERNPSLPIRTSEAAGELNMGRFVAILEEVVTLYKLEPASVWSMDETGICVGCEPGGRDYDAVGCSPESGTVVTLSCAVSAAGTHISPFFVFPCREFHPHFLLCAPRGSAGAANPRGRMEEEHFVAFLEHFARLARCSRATPRLLLLEKGDSRLSLDGLHAAKENGVLLMSYPPGCSRRLRPSDLSALKAHVDAAWLRDHPGETMSAFDVPGLVAAAFPLALTADNIRAGFRASGIYPFEPEVLSQTALLTADPTKVGTPPPGPSAPSGLRLRTTRKGRRPKMENHINL